MGERIDWPGLMVAGLRGLGLRPVEFWALTPLELRIMLGAEAAPVFTRARLDELLAAFPDKGDSDGADREPDRTGRGAGTGDGRGHRDGSGL